MDWAHDHLGVDMPAWMGGISAYGLKCPSCGEPVRRRAGRERAAHFAHFSHRAKPDCENYFPSNTSDTPYVVRPYGAVLSAGLGRDSLTCFLFLAHQERHDALAMWLRVPPASLPLLTGTLEIQTGVGNHVYQLADLPTARFVPIAPQIPLADCSGTGALLPLAAHISGQLAAFASGNNFFYAGERGGRLLSKDEPLEWGTRYWLVTSNAIDLPIDLTPSLGWRPGPGLNEWNTFEVALPAVFPASRPRLPEQISAFLGRQIRCSRPRLFVAYPSPHHVEMDGTYVYAAPPEYVLVRRTGIGKVTCEASSGADRMAVTEVSQDWTRLEHLPLEAHECTICIDDRPQLVLRVEECELFRPPGIVVKVEGLSWDLCTAAPASPAESSRAAVTFQCASELVATHVCRINPGLRQEGTVLFAPQVRRKQSMQAALEN